MECCAPERPLTPLTDNMPDTDKKRNENWIPEQIGHYKVLEIIGMGGMGVIYKALQQPLNRVVALKVLPPQYLQDTESSMRFESEARAVSMLEHQNIVQIYEYGEESGTRFIAMQYVDGENLAQRINGKKPMPIVDVVNVAKQICRGLRYAHSKEIIHRDIKPQNVLIDKNNVVRVTDFGIAKIISQNDITVTGVTVGTPEYMSPEQAGGQPLTTQTDIYSLGILIYEMLTKTPPFTGNNPISIAYKQVHELPLPPSLKRKDTPKRLELIVLKALKKKLDERYQTVEEMLDHLDSVDLDEKSDRTTVLFAATKGQNPDEASPDGLDKRITDRRNGDRRHVGSNTGWKWYLKPTYWVNMVQDHWPIILVVLVLYALFVGHLLSR
jgi:serine/threonine protein kinase